MVAETVCAATSQIFTSPLRAGRPPAAASSLPSREKARARTASAWPGSVASGLLRRGIHEADLFVPAERDDGAVGAPGQGVNLRRGRGQRRPGSEIQ